MAEWSGYTQYWLGDLWSTPEPLRAPTEPGAREERSHTARDLTLSKQKEELYQ